MSTQRFQPYYYGAQGETNVNPDRLNLIALLPGESVADATTRFRANPSAVTKYPILALPGTAGRNTLGITASMRYTPDNSGTIRIDGQSQFGYSAYQMSIRRQDGIAMSMSNADNTSLQSDVFYPSSPQFDWTFYNVPQVPLVLTFKKGFDVKEVNVVATPTAPIQITTVPPVTTSSAVTTSSTAPTSSAPISYSKILIIGNSFTDYTGGRGYQASDADHDYKHLLRNQFKTLNPNAVTNSLADLSNNGIGDGPYWEGLRGNNLDGGLARFDVARNFLASAAAGEKTAIIMRLGDNVPDATNNFAQNFLQLIQYVTPSGSNPTVIVTSAAFPNKGDVNSAMQGVANTQNYIYVNLQGLPGINAGADNHANDQGMQSIADAIWNAVPKSGIVAPTTSSSPSQTTAYYNYGFGEGTFAQLVQSAPFFPTNNQFSSWPTGNTTQYLDNGTIRFGIGKAIGGAIKHLGMSGGGMNWINTNTSGYPSTYEGQPAPDTGRSAGFSMYGTPGHDYVSNTNPPQNTNRHYDTGRNPVHGGSVYQDHSPITFFERRTVGGYGEVLYCQTVPYIWAFEGILSDVTYHIWWWLEGNNVRYFAIIDNRVVDNGQILYQGSQQEGPFIYTTGNLYKHYIYDGPNPKSGGALRDVSRSTVGLDSNPYPATEPWIASVDTNGNGVVLLSQHNNRMMGGQFVAFEGDEYSNESSYINSAQMMNFDVKQTTAFGGYIWAGSLQGFRNWYNSSTIQYRPFSFTFGQHNTCGWWTSDTPAKWNDADRYEFTFGRPDGGGGNFCPPYGIYPAAQMPTLYIKGKFKGGISKVDIRWNQSSQDDNQSNQAGQVTTIDVIGDGVERVYTVQMAGKNGWSNIIASMRIGPRLGDSASTNWKLEPSYIGYINPVTN